MFSLKSGFKSKILLASLLLGITLNAAELKMATTTSTDNTGLLDVLAPEYKKDTGVDLKWVAVGTGNALKLGENCDVSIVFVHSPKAELEYVKNGFGIDRTPIMYNDFVIVGAPKYKELFSGKNIAEAFKIVEADKIKFVSRGDKSGTHNKEREVWSAAVGSVPEKQSWYIESGQGMIATINIAEEQKGITLTDRGTFIKYEANHKGNPPLVIVLEGDDNLKNFYSLMAVNPARCSNADYEGAKKFTNWITSDKIQQFIADFKLLDKQLFTPDFKTRQ
ncbi:MAG: tungstate ABC transporter substrate-binding protein TupA [Campylobacteraceae bacterium]